jgi:hypothetical protein
MSRWRVASASVIGTAHLRHQLPCQDFSLCSIVDDRLICAISDGAGTAARSDTGARITATYFVQSFSDVTDLAAIDRHHMAGFFSSLTEMLSKEANENRAALSDYACTLLGVIATPTSTAYFQIGDGAIVIPAHDLGAYGWVFWPQHGEYANTTNFVTQATAQDVCELRIGPAVGEFAMFSDGLERLILHEATRRVHAPALRPIFDWFRTAEAEKAGEGSRALKAYLGSDHINRRTDDDKSLVVAVLAQD